MKIIQGQPYPLGMSKIGNIVNFAIEVADDKPCSLLLYRGEEGGLCNSFLMEKDCGCVQCLAFEDMDTALSSYKYQIGEEVFIDPYAKRMGNLQNDNYDWEGDKPLHIPYEDVVAYTLHIRGFTMDSYSEVENKGTFEGVIEKIEYLQELGINQIQCMPIYEFDNLKEKTNYWGYGPAYYFTPKNSYSAIGDGHVSLKNMVKALHRAGIEIILEMPFDVSMPKAMMAECLRYYVSEYHVDGFILNPDITPMDVVISDAFFKKTKIMKHSTWYKDCMRQFLKGDAGQIGSVIYWLGHISKNEGIFNYLTSHSGFTLHDLVSYYEKHNEENGDGNRDGVDNNNSWNWGVEGATDNEEILALRSRIVKNAYMLLLLSQGTPCLLAGDEFLNSQNGNNNVYCQDNETGWLNWENYKKDSSLYEYVKKLIELRKKYKIFHPASEFQGDDRTNCGIPDISYHGEEAWMVDMGEENRRLGVFYYSEPDKEEVLYVAYNMHWEDADFALPKLPERKHWYLLAETDEGVLEKAKELENQKAIEVKSRTIAVFAGR